MAIDYTNYGTRWVVFDGEGEGTGTCDLRIYDDSFSYIETLTVPFPNDPSYTQIGFCPYPSSYFGLGYGDRNLVKYNYDGDLVSNGPGISFGINLASMFVDENNSFIYVGTRGASNAGKIWKNSLITGAIQKSVAISSLIGGESRPRCLYFDGTNLFVLLFGGIILKLDADLNLVNQKALSATYYGIWKYNGLWYVMGRVYNISTYQYDILIYIYSIDSNGFPNTIIDTYDLGFTDGAATQKFGRGIEPSTTTTTTTSGTTTTTTPTIVIASSDRTAELKNVKTVIVDVGGESLGTDSSDNKGTLNTINSTALSFGPLAPGEISPTLIVYLNIPAALTLDNIRLALTDIGDLPFGNSDDAKFGVEIRPFIDYNVIPSGEFEGVNTTLDPESIYNVSIDELNLQSSQYVYLNVSIPRGQRFGTGTIRYKWLFDYA